MAVEFETGTFTKSTGGAPVSQDVTLGFDPKAVILFSTSQTAAGMTDGWRMAMGFAAGSGGESAVSASSRDNVAASTPAARIHRLATKGFIINKTTGTGNQGSVVEGDVTLGINKFSVNWTTNDAVAYKISYMAFGGDDITDVFVGSLGGGTSGNQAITDVLFQPDICFFMGTGKSTDTDGGAFSFGAAISSTKRFCMGMTSEDWWNGSGSVTDDWSFARTDRCFCGMSQQTGSATLRDFVSMDTNGFTVNNDVTWNSGLKMYYLCIKGGSWDIGTFNQETSTGSKGYTGVGFEPSGIIFGSHGQSSYQTSSSVSHARVSIGATDGVNETIGCTHNTDAQTTSKSARKFETDACLADITAATTGSSSTLNSEADITSLDSDGWTLNWSTADGAARKWNYIACGPPPAGGAGGFKPQIVMSA